MQELASVYYTVIIKGDILLKQKNTFMWVCRPNGASVSYILSGSLEKQPLDSASHDGLPAIVTKLTGHGREDRVTLITSTMLEKK